MNMCWRSTLYSHSPGPQGVDPHGRAQMLVTEAILDPIKLKINTQPHSWRMEINSLRERWVAEIMH